MTTNQTSSRSGKIPDEWVSEQVAKILSNEIEPKFQIVALFASECGSRAHGWDSMLSDRDIYFLYVPPIKYYLSFQTKPTTMEYTTKSKYQMQCGNEMEVELNFVGYEFRHAISLFQRSNPQVVAMLSSPVVYFKGHHEDVWSKLMKPFIDQCHSMCNRRITCLSLLTLCKTNFLRYIFQRDKRERKEKLEQPRVKVYLYMVHFLLYVRYVYYQELEYAASTAGASAAMEVGEVETASTTGTAALATTVEPAAQQQQQIQSMSKLFKKKKQKTAAAEEQNNNDCMRKCNPMPLPPKNIDDLLNDSKHPIPAFIKITVEKLLVIKRQEQEREPRVDRIPELDLFFAMWQRKLRRWCYAAAPQTTMNNDELDEILWNALEVGLRIKL